MYSFFFGTRNQTRTLIANKSAKCTAPNGMCRGRAARCGEDVCLKREEEKRKEKKKERKRKKAI